jgi:tetratricopeptide (TPR) repeat protein
VGENVIGGFFSPIIERNSTIPVTRRETFSTVSDHQTEVKVRVFQGDSHLVRNNIFLDEYSVTGLPRGRAGQERIEIAFTYDINGILQVDTTVLSTGRRAGLTVSRPRPGAGARERLAADWSGPSADPKRRVETLVAAGDVDAAVVAAEANLAANPGNDAKAVLADALFAAGRPVPATRILEELAAAAWPGARRKLAERYLDAGRLDEALMLYETDGAHAEAGILALRRGMADRAIANLRAALEKTPGDPRLLDAWDLAARQSTDPLALALPLAGRPAAWHWGRARATARRAPSPLSSRVDAALSAEDPGALRPLIAGADDPLAAILRGDLHLVDRRSAAAEAEYFQATVRWPTLAVAWSRLAEVRAARPAEALPAIERWIALSPDDPDAHEALGDARWALGAREDALAAWRRAELGGSESAVQKRGIAGVLSGAAGVIRALGWHPNGGTASPVQAVVLPGNGGIEVTGNLGKTGTEAATVAWTCLRTRARELGVDPDGKTLHLHFTNLAVEKDGPSAGLAFFLAALSALRGAPLPADLAATGEVDLLGGVRAVGGIEEKLRAAAISGVRRVLVPRQNLPQVEALPTDLRSRLVISCVGTVAEAAALAFSS